MEFQQSTTPVSMSYQVRLGWSTTLTGTLRHVSQDVFHLDVQDSGPLPLSEAMDAMRFAIRDDRIKVPPAIRIAIENGAKII